MLMNQHLLMELKHLYLTLALRNSNGPALSGVVGLTKYIKSCKILFKLI